MNKSIIKEKEIYSKEIHDTMSENQFDKMLKMKEEECEKFFLSRRMSKFISEN